MKNSSKSIGSRTRNILTLDLSRDDW